MMVIGSTRTRVRTPPPRWIRSLNTDLGSLRIEATLAGYLRMLAWAKQWPHRQWAIENAGGLGHHLAQWLLARGEVVLDVPSTATARVRELSRGARRKNDRSTRPGRRVWRRRRAMPAR